MGRSMIDICYACEEPATTREHVPPQCIFPESKDIETGADLRRNLLTVPSCETHNSSKSRDDEYLMWLISLNLPANSVARRQIETKLVRAHVRAPSLGNSILSDGKDVIVSESHSGREHEATQLWLNGPRFDSAISLVARGLFCHHFEERWLGPLRVVCDFVDFPDEPDQESLQQARIALYDYVEELFSADVRHGENPDVFWYKVNESGDQHRCYMRLCFYGSCTALALFG